MRTVCLGTVLLTALIVGCGAKPETRTSAGSGQPPIVATENTNPSHYERNEGKHRVIVFVHGVFGSAEDTWTCPKSGTTWPRLLKEDSRFGNSDIYVVNYPTTKLNHLMSIDDVVGNVMNRLQGDGVLDHQELVFVGHSMGGLVIERLLLRNQTLAPKVKFLFFASTPQEGSQIVTLGHLITGNPQLAEMLPGDANVFLEGLDTGWRDARFQIPIACVIEREATNGFLVVGRYSGSHNCESVVPIPANHIDVAKPCHQEDDVYVALWNAYRAHPILHSENASKQWTSYQEVGCDQTKRDTIGASVQLATGEEVTGPPVAELVNKNNIRNEDVKVVSSSANTAQILYNFDGQAKNMFGNCPGGGHATLVVTFPIRRTTSVE